MPLDREDRLNKAEQLLRQGKLDAAIAEYGRLVEDQPDDWNTTNLLGDLYARAGRSAEAAAQYARVADQFMRQGAYPKAAAFYKKLLKIDRDDERAQLQLAEIAARQGLLADARASLETVALRRRARGDERGVAEIVAKLGALDPADIPSRIAGAQALERLGETAAAVERYRALHRDLLATGRDAQAREVLQELGRLSPGEQAAVGAPVERPLDPGVSAGPELRADDPAPAVLTLPAVPAGSVPHDGGWSAGDEDSAPAVPRAGHAKSLEAPPPADVSEEIDLTAMLGELQGDDSPAVDVPALEALPDQSAAPLERASDAPAPAPEDRRALLYELGVALDQAGESARALAVFLELTAQAGEYGDVAARVDRLARARSGG